MIPQAGIITWTIPLHKKVHGAKGKVVPSWISITANSMNSALEAHLIVIGMELGLESVILINFSAFVRSFHTILIPSVLMRTIN